MLSDFPIRCCYWCFFVFLFFVFCFLFLSFVLFCLFVCLFVCLFAFFVLFCCCCWFYFVLFVCFKSNLNNFDRYWGAPYTRLEIQIYADQIGLLKSSSTTRSWCCTLRRNKGVSVAFTQVYDKKNCHFPVFLPFWRIWRHSDVTWKLLVLTLVDIVIADQDLYPVYSLQNHRTLIIENL